MWVVLFEFVVVCLAVGCCVCVLGIDLLLVFAVYSIVDCWLLLVGLCLNFCCFVAYCIWVLLVLWWFLLLFDLWGFVTRGYYLIANACHRSFDVLFAVCLCLFICCLWLGCCTFCLLDWWFCLFCACGFWVLGFVVAFDLWFGLVFDCCLTWLWCLICIITLTYCWLLGCFVF